jgi:7-carboxy-7-deazaguanine synthase
MMLKTFPVVETFGPTVQGEGFLAGQTCYFVRFAFCDYRCVWCDTKYSWRDPVYEMLTAEEIAGKLQQRHRPSFDSPMWVVLTGGNPTIQPHMDQLFRACGPRTQFTVETQGTIWRDWLNHVAVHHIAISPKLQSSGMSQTREGVIEFLRNVRELQRIAIKVVCFTPADVDEAIDKFYGLSPNFVLQVGTTAGDTDATLLQRYRGLTEYVLKNKPGLDARILPQMHVLLWGHKKGV